MHAAARIAIKLMTIATAVPDDERRRSLGDAQTRGNGYAATYL